MNLTLERINPNAFARIQSRMISNFFLEKKCSVVLMSFAAAQYLISLPIIKYHNHISHYSF